MSDLNALTKVLMDADQLLSIEEAVQAVIEPLLLGTEKKLPLLAKDASRILAEAVVAALSAPVPDVAAERVAACCDELPEVIETIVRSARRNDYSDEQLVDLLLDAIPHRSDQERVAAILEAIDGNDPERPVHPERIEGWRACAAAVREALTTEQAEGGETDG